MVTHQALPSGRGGDQVIPRPAVWALGGPPPWSGRSLGALTSVVDRVASRPAALAPPPFADARRSAVLVLLHDAPDGPEVLLTRRAMHLRHHRGEISFPGGRVDAGETPDDTARREAFEEVAIDPATVRVHGHLDHVVTVVSSSHIVPVVATVANRPVLTPSPDEVDRAFWVSLADLADPTTYREERWGTPPADRSVHFFELEGDTVWGATGRMLHQLLRVAHGLAG